MYMGHRFSTVDEGNDVGMVKAFEDLDLGVEVLLEFLVQLGEIDRFDCYESSGSLQMEQLALLVLQNLPR
jgi:hypothetical protein